MSRVLTLGWLAVMAVPAWTADPPKKPTPEEAMAAMMKHATPGPEHKKLDPTIGSWTFTLKMWEDPAGPPSEMTGTSERKWMLDGRFLLDETSGEFGGMKFQGYGLTAYDNTLKKYHGVWIDNMTTSIMTLAGTVDESGKIFTFSFEMLDPVLGKLVPCKEVMTIVSPDEQHVVMTRRDSGKEEKMMEFVYKRKK